MYNTSFMMMLLLPLDRQACVYVLAWAASFPPEIYDLINQHVGRLIVQLMDPIKVWRCVCSITNGQATGLVHQSAFIAGVAALWSLNGNKSGSAPRWSYVDFDVYMFAETSSHDEFAKPWLTFMQQCDPALKLSEPICECGPCDMLQKKPQVALYISGHTSKLFLPFLQKRVQFTCVSAHFNMRSPHDLVGTFASPDTRVAFDNTNLRLTPLQSAATSITMLTPANGQIKRLYGATAANVYMSRLNVQVENWQRRGFAVTFKPITAQELTPVLNHFISTEVRKHIAPPKRLTWR